ncbi:MAG: methylated-DNA--[protein]-cysteine S-methyltransferase [Leptothrix sp. (in: b-proteobacteria)]
MNTTYWTRRATPLGPMILAASDAGLQGAWFEGQAHFDGVAPQWLEQPEHAVLRQAAAQLDAWYAGQRTGFDLPLAPQGTSFQQAVWQAIAQVGFGATQGYGAVAAVIGKPAAARAVGAATGRNPLSIIVPCHRLVGRSGALTGYAGGLARKRALLAFEAGDAAALESFT